ncbi:cell wall anchor protein [Pontimicrobium sp. SW4]|uniref:Cell wall anchor protein n=1 Tax=Pontimicrobium sp. SW4 TaxID=3153519 RepID=A0AAU7BXF2_9FLAO
MNFKKILLVLLITIFSNISVTAQIGIGTSAPDASSILDMTSTTQGVLAPRMTTAQRLAISNPAKGLLVFDIDSNSFYFFNGGSWEELKGAVKRDNYKLVKSVADLADELVAGGGSKYLLSSNYLYEINGTIAIDFPIELNGAYVKGEDNVEDRLLNSTGGTLFTGNTGGNLKRLTVLGNGNPIFNITGSGSENLICLATNFIGASSIGSLSSLNIVFFNTGQFISNASGLTVSNINSYFMTLFTWTASNSGTFLNMLGTFNEVQLTNSNVNISSGVGIDVSSNPTVAQGTLFNVAFAGAGTYVNGYTTGSYVGFNFTNDWFVNCPGIPLEADWIADGNLYIAAPIETSITSVNTPVKIAGTTSPLNLFRTESLIDNRLTYVGEKTRFFSYSCALTVTSASNNQDYSFYIAKNGVILPESKQGRKIATGADKGSITITGVVQLSPNDYIEVWVENNTGSVNITAESMNLLMK